MPETFVFYEDIGNSEIVRFSGRLDTSVVRLSANISGLPSSVQGAGIDDDNYAIGANTGSKIWYMSGHYTSTVLNSVNQPTITGSVFSISLNDDNTSAQASISGEGGALILLSGKVTSTVKATFFPSTQSHYPGTRSPKTITLVRKDSVDKPVFYVPVPPVDLPDPIYIRLTSIFGSLLGDVEFIPEAFDISADMFTFTGDSLLWADSAGNVEEEVMSTGYFNPVINFISTVTRPAWVIAGGFDDIDSDTLQERLLESFSESVEQTFTFTQQVDIPFTFVESLTQQIVFGQDGFAGSVFGSNDLALTQEVLTTGTIFTKSLSQLIDLSDFVSLVVEPTFSAPQTINFTQLAEVIKQGIASNTLLLTDVAVGEAIDSSIEQTLILTDESSGIVDTIPQDVSDNLVFEQIIAFWLSTASDCIYDPQPPRSIDFPVLTRTIVTLQDNLPVPVNIVSIRNPAFGNTESIEVFRAFNTSRNRTRHIFRDPDWPNNRQLSLVSEENTQAEADTLLDFLSDTLGKEIRIIDWENRTWIAIVTNPESAVRDLGACRFKFEIDFIGYLVETEGVIFIENMIQSITFVPTVVKIKLCPPDLGCPDDDETGFPPSGG